MTAVERRRSPLRQRPVGSARLPGLCTEPGCTDVWLIERDQQRLCRTHHSAAPVAPSAPVESGLAGGASRVAGPIGAFPVPAPLKRGADGDPTHTAA